MEGSILKHYLKPEVLREMSEWLRGRWIAIEGYEAGRRVFIRHGHGCRPLTVSNPRDLERLVLAHRSRIRTVYGSINVYQRLESDEDTEILPNIVATTPSWDIDTSLEKWKYAIEAAKVLIETLEKFGVIKSVYLVWSGEGVHIHINENALSEDVKKRIHPFDAAYAVVEFVLRVARPRLIDIVRASGGVLKIENVVDMKRVFTAPLAVHRKYDLVAVCFSPSELEAFDISWAKLDSYRHAPCWKNYVEGELDELAERAIKEVGLRTLELGVPRVRRSAIALEPTLSSEEVKVGRFEVMALLQAARYYVLTGDLEKAKSFGLNRAIFYAWAKHYGPRSRASRIGTIGGVAGGSGKRFIDFYGEKVPVSQSGWFIMGDREQLPEDFDRQIKSKLEIIAPWERIWKAAVEYVSKFPQHILKDPQKFFEHVYLPVRDSFVEKVLKRYGLSDKAKDVQQREHGKSLLDFLSKK